MVWMSRVTENATSPRVPCLHTRCLSAQSSTSVYKIPIPFWPQHIKLIETKGIVTTKVSPPSADLVSSLP
jgi:hypothetical protein